MKYTDEQLQAIQSESKSILCLAGAGSGKTRVLISRIVRLVQTGAAKPSEILCLTFTRKAAKEMHERLASELGDQIASHFWIGTFHSIALRMIKEFGHTIGYDTQPLVFDDVDRMDIITGIVKDFGMKLPKKTLEHELSVFGSTGIMPTDPDMMKIFSLYLSKMREWKCLCFNLILYECKRMLTESKLAWTHYHNKFKHIAVDEYQDTDRLQYDLHNLLAPDNLFVVGDDFQSVYSWRGAEVGIIMGFEKDHPECEIIKLQQNFRSTKQIVDIGNKSISFNTGQYKKDLWSDREGMPVEQHTSVDDLAEAMFIADTIAFRKNRYPLSEIAVLYRKHTIAKEISEELSRRGIPHQVVTAKRDYLKSAEVKDLIAHMYGAINPSDGYHVEKAVKTPYHTGEIPRIDGIKRRARGCDQSLYNILLEDDLYKAKIAKFKLFKTCLDLMTKNKIPPGEIIKTAFKHFGIFNFYFDKNMVTRIENMNKFIEYAEDWSQDNPVGTLVEFLEFLQLRGIQDEIKDRDCVTLCTAHASKGLEYSVVHVVGLGDGDFPTSKGNIEEERRLFYVACTRAKDILTLSHAEYRYSFGNMRNYIKSRFVTEVGL